MLKRYTYLCARQEPSASRLGHSIRVAQRSIIGRCASIHLFDLMQQLNPPVRVMDVARIPALQ
jgi:hypothetical protein